MVESSQSREEGRSTASSIEARLMVLARTMDVRDEATEMSSADADGRDRFGGAVLGHALYRHRSVFQGSSSARAWSHLELIYFRDIVPASAIRDLVFGQQPAGAHLLRAEILLPIPSAFAMPRGWRGSTDRPGRRVSIEYIDVRTACLDAYREVMRRHIGPAAAELVAAGEIGTFRAMETAVVLQHDPSLKVDWNQVHLSEVDEGFEGFGQMFDAALRRPTHGGGYADLFADLGRMRTIPRWTFNDAIIEADCDVEPLISASSSPDRGAEERQAVLRADRVGPARPA